MEEERWEEKSASFTKTVSNLYIEIKYCGDHSACPKKKIPLAYKNTMDTIDFFLIP